MSTSESGADNVSTSSSEEEPPSESDDAESEAMLGKTVLGKKDGENDSDRKGSGKKPMRDPIKEALKIRSTGVGLRIPTAGEYRHRHRTKFDDNIDDDHGDEEEKEEEGADSDVSDDDDVIEEVQANVSKERALSQRAEERKTKLVSTKILGSAKKKKKKKKKRKSGKQRSTTDENNSEEEDHENKLTDEMFAVLDSARGAGAAKKGESLPGTDDPADGPGAQQRITFVADDIKERDGASSTRTQHNINVIVLRGNSGRYQLSAGASSDPWGTKLSAQPSATALLLSQRGAEAGDGKKQQPYRKWKRSKKMKYASRFGVAAPNFGSMT